MATLSQTRTALVTGASSGFGLLTSVSLAQAGFQVVAGARDMQRTSLLLDAATRAGVAEKIDCHLLDVTVAEQAEETVRYMVERYGRIDALINNAGFALGGFAEDVTLDELRGQFETNFFGAVRMTKAVLPTMRAQHSGHIVMVSSISGRSAFPSVSSYASSKFALEGWSEGLRMETRALGIRVVIVEPGAYDTDIWSRNTRVAAANLNGQSANRERVQRFSSNIKTQSMRRANPQEVADRIVHIVQTSKPKLRHVLGKDARILTALRHWLPAQTVENILVKISKIDGK